MVKEIPLQNGMVALVDDEDFERCMEHNWYVDENFNVERKGKVNNIKKTILLKYFVLSETPTEGKILVHKDGNKFNFEKVNLKYEDAEKRRSKAKAHRNSTSKYKGVCWNKRSKSWMAYITFNKKRKHIGYFTSEDEAALAYNEEAVKLFGVGCHQNELGIDNRSETKKSNGMQHRVNKNSDLPRGVSREWNKFVSAISKDGASFYLGLFDTSVQAAKAYDKKAIELFGDKAILNFPTEVYT